jgi:hypothetical protein
VNPWPTGWRLRLAPLLPMVLVAGSCAAASDAPLPPSPPVAVVTMREYSFEHAPIPRGRVIFRVRNVGRQAHRLSLLPLPQDFPPILKQLRGAERRSVTTAAAIPDTLPGQSGTFSFDVVPGRYAIVCFLVEPDGTSHALKGMATEFRVR